MMCFGGGGGQQPYPYPQQTGEADWRTAEQKQRDQLYRTQQLADIEASKIDKEQAPPKLGSSEGSQVT